MIVLEMIVTFFVFLRCFFNENRFSKKRKQSIPKDNSQYVALFHDY